MSQPTTSGAPQPGAGAPATSLLTPNNGHSVNNSTTIGVDTDSGVRATPTIDDFVRMQSDPAFQDLRHRMRRFVFPMAAFFLVWYLIYMLLATYAHAFMSTGVVGDVNLGVVLGFGQFVSTFVITLCYVKFAGRTLDPRAAAIRAELEGADA